jgi:oligopeptide/dipeptide ABC transporter ATP-binding protein
MAVPVLEVEDLRVSFRQFEGVSRVLDGISFALQPNERVAIVGESGCGKSLTIRAVLGLLDPRRSEIGGRITLQGRDITRLSRRQWQEVRGRQISMIFQDPTAALNPVFRIGSQMAEIMLACGAAPNRRRALAIAAERLKAVAIRDPWRVLRAYPFELSGGMAQRVVIVMGMIARPKVIMADEPGASLDVTVQHRTLELLKALGDESGAAILMITHNLGVVRHFAHRVLVMYAGTIVEAGETAALFAAPVHPYTRALFAAVPRLTGGHLPAPIEGVVPSYLAAPAGCRFATRCPLVVDRCRAERPRPEAVGPEHVSACFRNADAPALAGAAA